MGYSPYELVIAGFLNHQQYQTATVDECRTALTEVLEVQMGRHFFVDPPNCYAAFTYEGKEFRTETHHGATNPFLGKTLRGFQMRGEGL